MVSWRDDGEPCNALQRAAKEAFKGLTKAQVRKLMALHGVPLSAADSFYAELKAMVQQVLPELGRRKWAGSWP